MRCVVRLGRLLALFMAAISLLAISILIPVGVVFRYVAGNPVGWIEPVCAILLVAFTFFSAAVTMADRLHVSVTTLVNCLPPRLKAINANIANGALFIFLCVATVCSWELVQSTMGQALPEVPALPAAVVYFPVPLGLGLMALMVLSNLVRQDFEESESEKAELHLD